jgi:hypothetical protein
VKNELTGTKDDISLQNDRKNEIESQHVELLAAMMKWYMDKAARELKKNEMNKMRVWKFRS